MFEKLINPVASYDELHKSFEKAQALAVAGNGLATQERAYTLLMFKKAWNAGLTRHSLAHLIQERKRRCDLLGLILPEKYDERLFFDSAFLSKKPLPAVDMHEVMRALKAQPETLPERGRKDAQIELEIRIKFILHFETMVIPKLGTPQEEEAIRQLLLSRTDRCSKTGYTGSPDSPLNRFCVGLALRLVDSNHRYPNRALWEILLPEANGVHWSDDSEDWPAYGEVLLSRKLKHGMSGKLWSYPLLIRLSQSQYLFATMQGKAVPERIESSDNERWLLSVLSKESLPDNETWARVLRFNSQHEEFWIHQNLAINSSELATDLLDFFQRMNRVLERYKATDNNYDAVGEDVGQNAYEQITPYLTTCALLIKDPIYNKLFAKMPELLEVINNLLNPNDTKVDTRSCFALNHRALTKVLQNRNYCQWLRTIENKDAGFWASPQVALHGTDDLPMPINLQRHGLLYAIENVDASQEDMPLLATRFYALQLSEPKEKQVTYLRLFASEIKNERNRKAFLQQCYDHQFELAATDANTNFQNLLLFIDLFNKHKLEKEVSGFVDLFVENAFATSKLEVSKYVSPHSLETLMLELNKPGYSYYKMLSCSQNLSQIMTDLALCGGEHKKTFIISLARNKPFLWYIKTPSVFKTFLDKLDSNTAVDFFRAMTQSNLSILFDNEGSGCKLYPIVFNVLKPKDVYTVIPSLFSLLDAKLTFPVKSISEGPFIKFLQEINFDLSTIIHIPIDLNDLFICIPFSDQHDVLNFGGPQLRSVAFESYRRKFSVSINQHFKIDAWESPEKFFDFIGSDFESIVTICHLLEFERLDPTLKNEFIKKYYLSSTDDFLIKLLPSASLEVGRVLRDRLLSKRLAQWGNPDNTLYESRLSSSTNLSSLFDAASGSFPLTARAPENAISRAIFERCEKTDYSNEASLLKLFKYLILMLEPKTPNEVAFKILFCMKKIDELLKSTSFNATPQDNRLLS